MKSLSMKRIKEIENKLNNENNSSLDNIEDIEINKKISSEERILNFIDQVKNPYQFNIEGYTVKFSFQDNDITAEQCIENVVKHIICK